MITYFNFILTSHNVYTKFFFIFFCKRRFFFAMSLAKYSSACLFRASLRICSPSAIVVHLGTFHFGRNVSLKLQERLQVIFRRKKVPGIITLHSTLFGKTRFSLWEIVGTIFRRGFGRDTPGPIGNLCSFCCSVLEFVANSSNRVLYSVSYYIIYNIDNVVKVPQV